MVKLIRFCLALHVAIIQAILCPAVIAEAIPAHARTCARVCVCVLRREGGGSRGDSDTVSVSMCKCYS